MKYSCRGLTVASLSRGAHTFFIKINEEGEKEDSGTSAEKKNSFTCYSIAASKHLVGVMKDGEKIIDENDVLDPLAPNNNERQLLIMSKDLEGFDTLLYDAACKVAKLFVENREEEEIKEWVLKILNLAEVQ